jgi:hypothetical protein
MRIPGFASIVVTGCIALAGPSALAQTASSDDVFTYKLEKTARFETGCFAMCDCAIVTHPIQGTFTLQHTGFDPLYDYYAITDVRWVVSDATTYATIHGSGIYKRGGEFALTHQLTLDLTVDGEGPQHFDSGMIVGGSEWPRIVIDVSLHRNSACVDTLIHVDATDPIATGISSSGGLQAPWVKVAPNPFRGETEFSLAVPRAGEVEVVVYDASGRAVRHLRSGWMASGVHPLVWDGRRDQGSPCASGVYFVGARVGTERITSRIVKVD